MACAALKSHHSVGKSLFKIVFPSVFIRGLTSFPPHRNGLKPAI
jgi:hypothetical protein